MDDPSQPETGAPGAQGQRLALDRAVILLGLFIIATVLLVGRIQPTSTGAPSGGSSAPTTTVPQGDAGGNGGGATTTTAPRPPTTTTTTAPKAVPNVPVMVANASGTPGAAATVTNRLQLGGWTVLTPVNASTHVTSSSVYYVQGQKSAAITLASSLGLPSSVVAPYTTAAPVSSIGTAELLVVVGPDLVSGGTPTTAAGN